MQHIPDIIKLAVEAAGGRNKTAEALGVHTQTISHWQRTRNVPSEHITRLCEMGHNVIKPEQVLAYIAEHAEKAAA